jgi:hypothetical protein
MFSLEIVAPGQADVYLACDEPQVPWDVVAQLDRAGIRVVGDLPGLAPDAGRLRRIVAGCAGVLAVPPAAVPPAIDGLPLLALEPGAPAGLDGFLPALRQARHPGRAYAFMIGRLERDFRHAREAMRAAVEAEAGIPCLWADDGRHRTTSRASASGRAC